MGLVCRKCGSTDRMANGRCRTCVQTYLRENKERIKAQHDAWYAANREARLAYAAAWNAANKESAQEWRVKNADKLKEQNAAWHATNKERRNAEQRERDKARYWADPEKARARIKNQRTADPEATRAKERAYRATRADKAQASTKAWIAKHPEYLRQRNANIKAKRRAVPGKLSRGYIKKLYAIQQGVCACCETELMDGYHLDHIMPVSLGGTHTDDNVQLLCPPCNLRKGAKHPDVFKLLPVSPRANNKEVRMI